MRRAVWVKHVGFCLVAVTVLAGVAYGDPIGTANVPQILLSVPFNQSGSLQRTFLTTDTIVFDAIYYDPNPTCAGVAPLFAQFFVFNLEGLFIEQLNASPGTVSGTGVSSKYKSIGIAL